ncbi:hypothetical protein IscW_ISCW012761 [Ixodes scapularis]|uniref:Uncharacterized protein n=1 Tax=Ixodes scapularis TaxID=6945 RepID=B7QB55_IXOSC|nr:hypothetical protein IscW_ISCW012761 [Ixodes scapularis]|eukprot:XP_002412781.1 hypothetical protein IscW_ISCW012761 [Ixodes scapularis]
MSELGAGINTLRRHSPGVRGSLSIGGGSSGGTRRGDNPSLKPPSSHQLGPRALSFSLNPPLSPDGNTEMDSLIERAACGGRAGGKSNLCNESKRYNPFEFRGRAEAMVWL